MYSQPRIPYLIMNITRLLILIYNAQTSIPILQNNSKGAFVPERSMLPESLTIDESLLSDPDAYPITVKVRHLSDEESNPTAYKGDVNGTRSGLFRSSLLSAGEEEKL
jgi:phenol 2-monooxygenase